MRALIALTLVMILHLPTQAGVTLSLDARWDAASRVISGNERSLDGGLRYSLQGSSFQAYRDSFTWTTVPSVSAFQTAVDQAFGAWRVVDPVSHYGTALNFVPDLSTNVERIAGFGTLSVGGAEIDLLASDAGSGGLMGFTAVGLLGTPVTLTSGVANYTSSVTITGVDLHLNSNATAVYSLDAFRRVLTHEIGHAIGLGDVDQGGNFIDDNYSGANPVATLTNSWAAIVDPLDPANSLGLSIYSVPSANFALAGVDILMESNGLGLSVNNSLSELFPLRNDDYGMRQYLYPSLSAVPEPSGLGLLGIFALGLFRRSRRA